MLPRRIRCPYLPALLQGLVLWQALWLPLPAPAADNATPTPSTAADPAAVPEPDPERRRELLTQRSQLAARIEQLEQQDRSTDSSLQSNLHEARLALGTVLQELELHAEASTLFDAAWQARRVEAGLDDPEQLPILRQLFASQRAAQQWDAADTTAHLIHHIASRAYTPGTPERLDALLLLGRWKLLAARDDLLPNAFATAFQASELYRNEIQALQQAGEGTGDPIQLATLHLEKASAAYLLAREIDEQPLQEYFLGGQRSTTMLQCQPIRFPDGSTQRICTPVEVPNVDFYVDPSNRKHQDIARFLGAMRQDLAAAFTELSQTTDDPAERDLLLQDMHGLTELYNDFATRGSRGP